MRGVDKQKRQTIVDLINQSHIIYISNTDREYNIYKYKRDYREYGTVYTYCTNMQYVEYFGTHILYRAHPAHLLSRRTMSSKSGRSWGRLLQQSRIRLAITSGVFLTKGAIISCAIKTSSD